MLFPYMRFAVHETGWLIVNGYIQSIHHKFGSVTIPIRLERNIKSYAMRMDSIGMR